MNINKSYLAAIDSSLGFKPRLKARIWVGSITHHFAELYRSDYVMVFYVWWQRPRRSDLELWPTWPWRFMNAGSGGGVAAWPLFEWIYPVTDPWSAQSASPARWSASGSIIHVVFGVVMRWFRPPPEVAGQSSRWRHIRSVCDVIIVLVTDTVSMWPYLAAVRATHARLPAISPTKLIVYHVTDGAGTRHRMIMTAVMPVLVLGLILARTVFAHARRFLLPPEEASETFRRYTFTTSGFWRQRCRTLPVFIWRHRHLQTKITTTLSNFRTPHDGIGALTHSIAR